MVPFRIKDLWFTALWEDFFKFHKLPEVKKPFSVSEWQDYFYKLGRRYVLENLYCVNWLESKTFEVFANTKFIKPAEIIVQGFDIVNKQLGSNFRLNNLGSPILIKREDVKNFLNLRRKKNRNYGLLFVFDSLPPNTRYSPHVFSDGSAFPREGIIEIGYRTRVNSKEINRFARQLKITAAHELFEILTPEYTPHCNYMTFSGKYMIGGEKTRGYHTKRCLHNTDNATYINVCPLCKDMAIYFLKGVEEAKNK